MIPPDNLSHLKFIPVGKGYRASEPTEGVHPQNPPNSERDFRKIMERDNRKMAAPEKKEQAPVRKKEFAREETRSKAEQKLQPKSRQKVQIDPDDQQEEYALADELTKEVDVDYSVQDETLEMKPKKPKAEIALNTKTDREFGSREIEQPRNRSVSPKKEKTITSDTDIDPDAESATESANAANANKSSIFTMDQERLRRIAAGANKQKPEEKEDVTLAEISQTQETDLSKEIGKSQPKTEAHEAALKPAEKQESPFSIYKKLATNKEHAPPLKKKLSEIKLASQDENTNPNSTKVEQPTVNLKTPEMDLTQPMRYNSDVITVAATAPEGTKTISADMQELIDHLANSIHTVQLKGQTDTVINIKNSPLFEGATVVVSAFETAKNEFNVSFENLTQAAKQVIDMNQNALRLALEEKGVVLHMIVATTLTEHRIEKSETFAQGNREGRGGSDQQGNQKNPNREKEK